MTIKDLFESQFMIFDGAMGTMLQKSGLKGGELPESYNLTHPHIIREIHESYVRAGADVITTNTFQANELKLKHGTHSIEQVIQAGVQLAKKSGAKQVALDIGPLGQLIEPTGKITFEESYELFAKQVKLGAEAGADLILLETFSDVFEAKAAILAAKENSALPIICTLTFQKNQRTLLGTDPITATLILQSLGVDALGLNCSLGPKELEPIAEDVLKYAKVPVIVQPNAGLPKLDGDKTYYDLTPEEFAESIKTMAQSGVRIFGGCCGTTPEYIMTLKRTLSEINSVERLPEEVRAACSDRETVMLDKLPLSVGTIDLGDPKAIVSKARKLLKEGAQLIKINFDFLQGKPVDELVKKMQKTIHTPFIIEASNIEIIEKAIRVYNGKPIVCFLNSDQQARLQASMVVSKYGAELVGQNLFYKKEIIIKD